MTERLLHGRVQATISDIVDLGPDLLPHFEMAAVPVLDGNERPAQWPDLRRRLRAEGIRSERHRGVILLPPGELDRFTAAGFFEGSGELFLCAEWDEEFEPFPGRVSSDLYRFEISTPIGLEEWVVDAGCLLVVGDGHGLNFATLDPGLGERLNAWFRPIKA